MPPPTGRLSFSKQHPELQLAWDSTSMGAFKRCQRYYYYSIVLGWVPRDESVHLKFGLIYHAALEVYDKVRARGGSHEMGMREATRLALTQTWDPLRKRPWNSDHKYKNRFTLVRSVVWYLDKLAEHDVLETITLSNGHPAVELSWRFNLDRNTSQTSEPLLLCGHLDKLAKWEGSSWVVDHKTSVYALDERFFDRYSPDNQMSTYSYAGAVCFDQRIKGVIINGVQVLIEGTRFQRGFVTRTTSQLEEWRSDLDYWLSLAEHCATTGYWPQNDMACGLFGGCAYRQICGKAPSVRADWLKATYVQRSWDPLQIRGDI